jgi:hypothetical protein
MRLALQHQVDAAQAHRHTARRIQGQVARLERARTAREIQRVVHPYGPDARRVRPTVGPHGRHEERHVGLGRVAGKNVARAAYGSSADAYRSRLRVEIGSVMVSVIPMRRTGPQIDTRTDENRPSRPARRRLTRRSAGRTAGVGSGEPFPGRDLIIFVTAGVIVMTLVQGLPLPSVVRWPGCPRHPAVTGTPVSRRRSSRRHDGPEIGMKRCLTMESSHRSDADMSV